MVIDGDSDIMVILECKYDTVSITWNSCDTWFTISYKCIISIVECDEYHKWYKYDGQTKLRYTV